MSRLLQALFGSLPIGWLKLTHSRTRFAAALAGVAFANVLVFVQLGIMNSMATATLKPYGFFQADIMISAADANAMAEGGNVARQWMLQAMAHPDVTAGMGLFTANVSWQRETNAVGLTTFGIDTTQPDFLTPDIAAELAPLQLQMSGLLDRLARGLPRVVWPTAKLLLPQRPAHRARASRIISRVCCWPSGTSADCTPPPAGTPRNHPSRGCRGRAS